MTRHPTLFTTISANDTPDDLECNDLEVGDQVFPLEDSDESQELDHELELGEWGPELNLVAGEDEEGPLDGAGLDTMGIECDTPDDDNPLDEGNQVEASSIADELPPSEPTDEFDESREDSEAPERFASYDADIPWSSQPWCEHRLVQAFTPRSSLSGQDRLVLATGESTNLLATDTCQTVAEAPLRGSTSSAVLLDDQASRVLLNTTTGQLLMWDRAANSVELQCGGDGRALDRVTRVCEGAPGSGEVWALVADGTVWVRRSGAEHFEPHDSRDGFVSIAPSESGLVALTRDHHFVCLSPQTGAYQRRTRLPEQGTTAPLSKPAILGVWRSFILVAARESGAWLSSDAGQTFREISGCRSTTACAFGTHAGRPWLWLALFRELDDRAELVAVDYRSRRTCKLANFAVVADCAGPEDDPPERARIDSLHWDPAHQRLWAAGCFGITCFEPSQMTQPPS